MDDEIPESPPEGLGILPLQFVMPVFQPLIINFNIPPIEVNLEKIYLPAPPFRLAEIAVLFVQPQPFLNLPLIMRDLPPFNMTDDVILHPWDKGYYGKIVFPVSMDGIVHPPADVPIEKMPKVLLKAVFFPPPEYADLKAKYVNSRRYLCNAAFE